MKMDDEIEQQIGEAMKPIEGHFGKRPRIEPKTDAELRQADEQRERQEADFQPVKTLVQSLHDLEQGQIGTQDRVVRFEKSLAEILVKIHERLSAIENTIGVR